MGRWRGPAFLILSLCLFGCAAAPLDWAERQAAPLSRSVAIAVDISEAGPEGLYGTREQWLHDLRRVFVELNACTRLVEAKEADSADMDLTVWLSPVATTEPDVQTTGALLDVLAWVTVPFLPLWIPDVSIQPALHVRVERSIRSLEGETVPLREAESAEADRVSTSYLDRRPFFSWTTLGALLVPPFVFSGTDPAHVEEKIGLWVREATAVKVAKIIRASQPMAGELLTELSVQARTPSKLMLSFTPGRNQDGQSLGLRLVRAMVGEIEVGSLSLKETRSPASASTPQEFEIDLRRVDGYPSHVTVHAICTGPPWSLSYTVRLPREDAEEVATIGGLR